MAGGRQLAEVQCLSLVLFQKVVPYLQKNCTASLSSAQEHTVIYLFIIDNSLRMIYFTDTSASIFLLDSDNYDRKLLISVFLVK